MMPARADDSVSPKVFALAAFTALVIVAVAGMPVVGMVTAGERIGCGLNDLVGTLALPLVDADPSHRLM